jgi:hypothetical protein
MRFRFIEDHRDVFLVRVMCAVLDWRLTSAGEAWKAPSSPIAVAFDIDLKLAKSAYEVEVGLFCLVCERRFGWGLSRD